jgi:hypothetical protein
LAVLRVDAAVESSSTAHWVHIAVEIPKASQRMLLARRIPPQIEDQNVALTAEIISFCPVPLQDWQERALLALQGTVSEWVERLETLRAHLAARPPAMWQVPFLRLLLDAEGPADWVRADVVHVDGMKIYGKAHGNISELPCLRRPFFSWPSLGAGQHVTTTGDGQRLEFRRPRLSSTVFGS